MGQKLIEDAPRDKRQEEAFKKDEIVENHIKENPNLNSVELEKILKSHHGFQRSYLKNALSRLEKKGKIISKQGISKEGKRVRLYRYNTENTKKPIKKIPGAISIPIKLLNDPNQWKQNAFVYGKTSNEIEISPNESNKLKETSFIKELATVTIDENYLRLTLPVRLTQFLELDVDNYNTSVHKNLIKIKIIPKIIKTPKKVKVINTILLLEDSDYWANEFEKELTKIGYKVYVAKSMDDVIKYEDKKIDYCILDDKIKFKNEAEDYFVKLKKKMPEIEGTFITVEPINQASNDRLTKLGFSSIIHKHRTENEKKDLEEILNEQITRLGMFSS